MFDNSGDCGSSRRRALIGEVLYRWTGTMHGALVVGVVVGMLEGWGVGEFKSPEPSPKPSNVPTPPPTPEAVIFGTGQAQ